MGWAFCLACGWPGLDPQQLIGSPKPARSNILSEARYGPPKIKVCIQDIYKIYICILYNMFICLEENYLTWIDL